MNIVRAAAVLSTRWQHMQSSALLTRRVVIFSWIMHLVHRVGFEARGFALCEAFLEHANSCIHEAQFHEKWLLAYVLILTPTSAHVCIWPSKVTSVVHVLSHCFDALASIVVMLELFRLSKPCDCFLHTLSINCLLLWSSEYFLQKLITSMRGV